MMYLLLRDNKQTGPYSLDELKAKGLKAYDLVWVEGRSAAWRYPSEVDELSAFAPAVEEQPFDRFYKKPAVVAAGSPAEAAVVNQAVAVNQAVVVNQMEAKPNRRIYVTMPGGIAARESARETAVAREIAPVREVVREIMPLREMQPEYRAARTEYIQREPQSEILPPLPRKKSVRLWQPVAIGVGVLLLLAAGIVIGLSIQKEGAGSFKLASKTSTDKDQQLVRTTAQQLPVTPVSTPAVGTTTPVTTPASTTPSSTLTAPVSGTTDPSQASSAAVRNKFVGKPKNTTPKLKGDAAKAEAVQPVAKDSVAAQPAMIRREAVHRSDAAESQPVEDKEGLKAALTNQVAVGTNKYEVGTFGGISNLQVTVSNRSAYSLDLVVVSVSYIQANKKIYKTETLYFRGIGPGSALMLEAPKSSRGINVQYKVTSINSKELGLAEPGI